jgi:hypothetical protein
MFDVVIPVGPNDLDIIKQQIEYTKKNVIDRRNIYIITPSTELVLDGCIIINDNIFPFSIKDLISMRGESARHGWYLQQLIKLYAGYVIPDILESYLVIDADTFFIKPTKFYTEDSIPLYNTGTEYHIPYFNHMIEIHNTLHRVDTTMSGICHHMLFEKKYIDALFLLVETAHKQPFWKVFIDKIKNEQYNSSGASEYEIYFNYMLIYYPTQIKLRMLKWTNTNTLNSLVGDYDYISYHWYMRR